MSSWPINYTGAQWSYPLKAGDRAEVQIGTWIPCVVKVCISAGNMIIGGPGYYVEYRTQNGDLVCHPVRQEYVRRPAAW
ncbi:hypothetical protein EXIGLDRAFT_767051 [Exidia glandulosa HHB12029]|uniref:Uncharacterized protein n=1 Tax=Exidia glandulosa HHB12029 TaxID=1314781 RepID=A0A165J9D1_EXIGL|nr:hypothetical protein EXIGLDRAFT_767051 [Exidia glandulosa HHB12029]